MRVSMCILRVMPDSRYIVGLIALVILSFQSSFAQTPIDKTTVEYQIELKNRTFKADAQFETGMNVFLIHNLTLY